MDDGDWITEAIERKQKWRNMGRPIAGWMIGRLTDDKDDHGLTGKDDKRFPRTAYPGTAVYMMRDATQWNSDTWLIGRRGKPLSHMLTDVRFRGVGAAYTVGSTVDDQTTKIKSALRIDVTGEKDPAG